LSEIVFLTEDIDFQLKQPEAVTDWLLQVANKDEQQVGLLEYVFASDDYVLQVNREHLDHDYFTDIITFPLQNSPLEATIFISVDRVKENADLYKVSFQEELHRVMVHGLLHLLGYDDKTENDKKNMRQQEDRCLAARTFV